MGNMIDIDYTILIQLVNFLVTVVVLNFLLIKPIREQIANRRQFTLSQAAGIDAFTADANTKLTAYEAALSEARAAAIAAREGRKAEGHAKEQAIISAAQADAQKFLRAARDETDREAKTAMDTLRGQVNDFAAKAASRIFS